MYSRGMEHAEITRVHNGWLLQAESKEGLREFVFMGADALADFVADWAREIESGDL